ncbi:MAG: hypothetical protein GDA56_32825 [Hormoscilla sp. GM7CHS1pb]|nr:hypothetical protein [Hormoscilla sp. GM7CHS1pb]
MSGGTGSDELEGGSGNDYLKGDIGSDTLHGGDGDDTLDGGTGYDYIVGGKGDDVIYASDGDTLVGGWGRDEYVLSGKGVRIEGFKSSGYLNAPGDLWVNQLDKISFLNAQGDLWVNRTTLRYIEEKWVWKKSGLFGLSRKRVKTGGYWVGRDGLELLWSGGTAFVTNWRIYDAIVEDWIDSGGSGWTLFFDGHYNRDMWGVREGWRELSEFPNISSDFPT